MAQHGSSDCGATTNKYSVIFIHGTWGRGFFPRDNRGRPRWFESGSEFRCNFELELSSKGIEYTIDEFLWSGSNSIFERDSAAQRLATIINETKTSPNGPALLLIAHSHGGNIALRALSYLRKEIDRNSMRIVTMATPFLQIATRNIYVTIYPYVALVLVASVFLSYYVAHLSPLKGLKLPFPLDPATESYSYTGMVTFIVSDFLFPIGVLLICILIGAILFLGSDRLFGLLPRQKADRAHELALVTHSDLRKTSNPPLLVLRGVDDEASGILTLGGLGIYMMHTFLRRTFLIAIGAIVAFQFMWGLFDAVARVDSAPESARKVAIWAEKLWLYSVWLPVVYFMAVLSAQAFRALFGRELLFQSARCEVIANSTPDFCERVEVVTFPPELGEGMRHALYQDRRCATAIVEWLTKVAKGPQSGTPTRPDETSREAQWQPTL